MSVDLIQSNNKPEESHFLNEALTITKTQIIHGQPFFTCEEICPTAAVLIGEQGNRDV